MSKNEEDLSVVEGGALIVEHVVPKPGNMVANPRGEEPMGDACERHPRHVRRGPSCASGLRK